jgi:hypothetical protein
MRTQSVLLDVTARVKQLVLLCQAARFKQCCGYLVIWLMRTQSVLLCVTARVKQLVLLCQAARFKQLVLWLLSDLANANTIRAVIRDSKG